MSKSKLSLEGVSLMLEEWIRGDNQQENSNWMNLKGGKGRYLLIIVICLGLLALIWPTGVKEKNQDNLIPVNNMESSSLQGQMVADLEGILSQIDGAGKVKVSISLASRGSKTYASNLRNEKRESKEGTGSNSKQTREDTVVRDLAVTSGNPLLVEEKSPEVTGVLVVADGAGNSRVRENLTQAVATLLNIASHKVTVMPRKAGI